MEKQQTEQERSLARSEQVKPESGLQVKIPSLSVVSSSSVLTAQGSATTVKKAENLKKKLP